MDEILKAYRTLGLDPGAPPKTVKKAYRSLVKTWHPDRHAADSATRIEAEERIKEINLAFERLQDFDWRQFGIVRPPPKPASRATSPAATTPPLDVRTADERFRSTNAKAQSATAKPEFANQSLRRTRWRWFKPLAALSTAALGSLVIIALFRNGNPRFQSSRSAAFGEPSAIVNGQPSGAPEKLQLFQTPGSTSWTALAISETPVSAGLSLSNYKSPVMSGSAQPAGESNAVSGTLPGEDAGSALLNALLTGLRQSTPVRDPGGFVETSGSIALFSNNELIRSEINSKRTSDVRRPAAELSVQLTNAIASLQATEQIRSALAAKRKAIDQGLSASQNDPISQYQLAIRYLEGPGATQDFTAAVRLFRQAAEAGHPAAQKQLGYLYATGKGVRQDFGEAAKWFQKAAEQGSEGATLAGGLLNLGKPPPQPARIIATGENSELTTNGPSLREALKNIQIRHAKPETKTNVEANPPKP